MKATNSYATDGKCHNADLGTCDHECGKPATWIGCWPDIHNPGQVFGSGFCDDCKERGYEAQAVAHWERIER